MVTGRKLPRSTKIGLFVQHLGGLEHFAVRPDEGRVGKALLHQLQAHQAVIDVAEIGSDEFDHVHLDPRRGKAVEQ